MLPPAAAAYCGYCAGTSGSLASPSPPHRYCCCSAAAATAATPPAPVLPSSYPPPPPLLSPPPPYLHLPLSCRPHRARGLQAGGQNAWGWRGERARPRSQVGAERWKQGAKRRVGEGRGREGREGGRGGGGRMGDRARAAAWLLEVNYLSEACVRLGSLKRGCEGVV